MKTFTLSIAVALFCCACSDGATNVDADIGSPDTARIALTDLRTRTYKGFVGGLYPDGNNEMPAEHAAEGRRRAALVVPRAIDGSPSPNGRIVLLSIGMSNGTQEFCNASGYTSCQPWTFMGRAAADPVLSQSTLRIVNGARGGQVASVWATSSSREYDRIRDEGLKPLGLSEAQVQMVWTKLANSRPTDSLPSPNADAYALQKSVTAVARALKERYPNLQMVFVSSRIYAGFATTSLNPEPYAYETGFAHKWAIEDQIRTRDYSGAWLAWGPYLWAGDKQHARSDGFYWEPADFQSDGTHPSQAGEAKVGAALLEFFKGVWFDL